MAHTHSVTAAGSIGNHTLTIAEIPSHTHQNTHTVGGYSGWGSGTTTWS